MSNEPVHAIGLLYTGGTIGMEVSVAGLAISSDAASFEARLRSRLPDDCPDFTRLDVDIPLIDSSNAQPDDWLMLARIIHDHRQQFSGFVVLTGTDTMAYTASALSFLLEGSDRPVVLTGSQQPLESTPTSHIEESGDAVSNVRSALLFCRELATAAAARMLLSSVFLAFDGLLLRGNCARKIDSKQFRAFRSPNLPPVGHCEGDLLRLDHDLLYRRHDTPSNPGAALVSRLEALNTCHDWNEPAVASCFLLPGAAGRQLKMAVWPKCRALLLFSYGLGNVPSDSELVRQLRKHHQHGLIMLNTTQCLAGGVGNDYAASRALSSLGVRSAGLMTPEAAFTKLHLFARLPDLYPVPSISIDLCGEQGSTV